MKRIRERLGLDPEMERALVLSLGFHGLVFLLPFLLAVLGILNIFEPEVINEPVTVELAQLSDISAAPKTDLPSHHKPEPKPQVQKPVEAPKPETPPPPPNPPSAAEPPPAPEKVEPVPEPEKKPPEKPLEEKPKEQPEKPKEEAKKEPEKKKDEKKPDAKKDSQALDALLKNVLKNKPAPKSEEKPKQTAEAPAEPSGGPATEEISEIPMTASEEDGIRQQIERNWNVPAGAMDAENLMVELRISLNQDGTVTNVQVTNDRPGDGFFRSAAESARRAVIMSSPLKLPPGKYWPTILLRFDPKDFMGG